MSRGGVGCELSFAMRKSEAAETSWMHLKVSLAHAEASLVGFLGGGRACKGKESRTRAERTLTS